MDSRSSIVIRKHPILVTARIVAIVIAGVLLAQPAEAQLRAFGAVKYMTLDPPMAGVQEMHADITRWLHKRRRFVKAVDDVPSTERHRFIRCRLRTDVPKPFVGALECFDAVGQYVATKRLTVKDKGTRWLSELLGVSDGTRPAEHARPLNWTRYLQIEFHRNWGKSRKRLHSFIEKELRPTDLTIVPGIDGLSGEDLSSGFLTCEVDGPIYPNFQETIVVTICFKNARNEIVREFTEQGRDYVFFDGEQRVIGQAIRRFKKALLEDAEIYDPRNRLPDLR